MAALVAAGWTASAGADLPPLPPPPVTVPSLTIPTVTIPPVTTPPVPQPPLAPPPPTVPSVTLPAVPSHPPLPVGVGVSTGGAGEAGGSNGAGAVGGGNSAGTSREQRARTNPQRVSGFQLARDWISRSGPRRHRRTMLVFTLRRAALVEFAVLEVSPDCRRVGRFRVRGHLGLNRVPLRSRVGRHSLSPGTYRLVARTLPSGRRVADTRLVVVQRLSRREIRSARTADVCGGATRPVAGSARGITTAPRGPSPRARPEHAPQPARHKGVLGARFARGAVAAAQDVPLLLYALLGIAIVLLAAAAVPRRYVPTTLLTRHREVVAFAGAALLVAVTITYALL